MFKNILITIISLLIFSAFTVNTVMADGTLPDFGSCVNPQGKVIASYETGSHGIVGRNDEVSGSDHVYESSKNGVTQCFCPTDGRGIQTNWLKTKGMSQSEINVLKNKGWTYIATGSAWGLKDEPYLAKNSDYACKKDVSVNKTPKVLGLASTGDSATIYTSVIAGALFLIVGLITRRLSK